MEEKDNRSRTTSGRPDRQKPEARQSDGVKLRRVQAETIESHQRKPEGARNRESYGQSRTAEQ